MHISWQHHVPAVPPVCEHVQTLQITHITSVLKNVSQKLIINKILLLQKGVFLPTYFKNKAEFELWE